MPARIPYSLVLPVAVLLLPIVVSEWYRYRALRESEADQFGMWNGYRSLGRFNVLTTLAVWWALWDLNGGYTAALKISPSWLSRFAQDNNQRMLSSVPLISSLFLVQFVNYSTDRTVSALHWSNMAIARRAWWSVVQNVISMLMVAVGFEAIFAGRYGGILWIIAAAVVHRVGMVCLRFAEGMRINRLKSGDRKSVV